MKRLRLAGLILLILGASGAILIFEADMPAAIVDARYTNDASAFLSLSSGARVHYRDQGNPNGATVVLIHGAMASLHTWEPWVRILGERYRVVTLDLPGHGLTGRVPDDAYGAESFTEAIGAVVDALEIRTFVLGGNSMGGGATWRYALAHPERVSAMILVDSVAPTGWREDGGSRQRADDRGGLIAFRLIRQGWFRALARYLDPRWLIEQGLRSAYNNSPVVDERLVDRYYDLIMREGTRAAILDRARSLGAEMAGKPDITVLTQPTLILWGAQDALIPVDLAAEFERRLPNARAIIYDGLGHVPMEEDPERTAADVIRFIESI